MAGLALPKLQDLDFRMKGYDLIVVGGGPAGTSAAISAAHRGATVLLLERGRFPRHKVCGEFVSAESLNLLAGLLDQQVILREAVRIPRARVFLDGRILQTAVDPPAVSIARLELDAALWRAAMNAGVDARQQVTVQCITGLGPFRVGTTSGEFETRALVNASGRWSNLNSQRTGTGAFVKRWLGLKAHFAEPFSEPSVDLYFFDGGYCGVQPVHLNGENSSNNGGVNASAMVRADVASTLAEVLALHPALYERSRNWRLLTHPVSTSPLIFGDPCPERHGILLVGDAAGFVDPFVGDGISLALRSGSLAALCLASFFAGETSLDQALSQYRDMYNQSLLPVFRASSRIRQMLRLPRSIRKPLLHLLESVPAITQYAVRKTR